MFNKPSRLIIEMIDKCNFSCIHCFANKNDKSLELDKWRFILDRVVKEDINSISITGGEPLLYKNFFDIFVEIDFKDTKLTLDTNSSLLNTNNIQQIKKYFKLVRVSIYGNDNISQRRITKIIFFKYNDLLSKIKLLHDNDIKIQVNIPMFKENFDNFEQILNDLSVFNIYEVVLIPIINVDRKLLKSLPKQKEIEYLFSQYKNKINLRLFKWAEGKHFLVRANGEVYLHPLFNKKEFYLGNILYDSIADMWEKVPEKMKRVNKLLTPNLSDI
jgi:MoaA/NifB/PqqE/SkfB family radical SAM enzyme